ncbi:MAG: aldo/keto reductase [Planctomycetota bacterium]|jgi:aryl-alcohol dehydrogenase-like predicted oxidoreductase
MERRDFLRTLSGTGLLSMLDPAYLSAKENLQSGKSPADPVPKRQYGRAEDMISVIGFGGMVVKDVTPKDASIYVSEAVDRGINYFDVAPTYGNAQERLGPALKPHRDNCFLACKTAKRDAAGAREELEASLKMLQTDHFDLYQLHAITTLDDVEQAFAKGGAMETYQKAQDEGKVRYLGFSAHSELAAHAALDRFDFDSILFPLSFPVWIHEDFGPSVHKRAKEANRGILAIKSMAHQRWPKSMKRDERPWKKTWYEPFDEIDKVALGLRFTFHLPSHAMIPPGHWELFKMAVELAQSGALTPLNDNEQEMVRAIAKEIDPIFTKYV